MAGVKASVRLTNPQQRAGGRRVGFWIAVALMVHAEVLLLGGLAAYLFAPRDADLQKGIAARAGEGESIDVGMLDDATARQLMADLDKMDEERKAEEEKKQENALHPPGQVVDLPTPREEKRPDDSKFVSEHDSTVTHETKKYGRFEDNSRQGDRDGTASVPQKASPSGDGRLAMRTPDLGKFLKAPGLSGAPSRSGRPGSAFGAPNAGPPSPDGSIPELGTEGQVVPPTGGGSKGGLGPSALMPNEQQLARAIGGGTQDALKDIDDGDETALNSKRWRFSSFFNRVKRQVAEHWHPDEVYRQRDPTGAVYGRHNRYTELRVQLKPDGRLSNVAVALPSGLEFLDDEAIEAFKEAGPFPNPPRQLIENGFINFGFGFLFDLNGPPQMRWFKYNN
jgi:TonB family protein